jgi:uncharacterized protein (TIGR02452 family)
VRSRHPSLERAYWTLRPQEKIIAMSTNETAAETLKLLENGAFDAPDGRRLSMQPALDEAIAGTRLYTPERAAEIVGRCALSPVRPPLIEVTEETTQIAARRLVEAESVQDLVLLNFASARNAGGGFLTGAKAQEEDLCRCSGLYPCLLTQPAYYEANRRNESALYTDHLIYSPNVPWFRARGRDRPDTVFLASVITAPAPNAGVVLGREAQAAAQIEATLQRRAGLVLAVAAEHGHHNLLLGAWGCGVFRNDPRVVADVFGRWLVSETFAGAFDRVVFAIYDRAPGQATLTAFRQRFPGA